MFTKSVRPRRGFTLVEILAVVVILGIASAIIIPQIGSRDDLRASAASRTLIADLIYAQNMAISTGTTTYVRFDLADESYVLLTSPTTTSPWGTRLEHPITQTNYITKFGPTSTVSTQTGFGVASLDTKVTINSALFDGIDADCQDLFTIGFDELGSPFVFNHTLNKSDELNSEGVIVIASGTWTNTVRISPATGEIQVTVP